MHDWDLTPRYVPDSFLVLVSGKFIFDPVAQVIAHPPHTHKTAIKSDLTCLEVTTEHGGKRYFGCERAYIDSSLRMVCIGTPVRDEVRTKWEEVQL